VRARAILIAGLVLIGTWVGPWSMTNALAQVSVAAAREVDMRRAGTALLEEKFEYANIERTVHLYVPDSAGTSPAPLIVLLHGSYSDGGDIAARWVELARREGFIVAAPDARERRAWQLRADGLPFMRALIEVVAAQHALDPRRIYLFGHSGGAVYALTLSMLESELYAATAVYAGTWRSRKEFAALRYARRAIPVALFIGDRDRFFSVQSARRTQQALSNAGHRTSLVVLPGRTHDYGPVAAEVNQAAWDFMKHEVLGSRAQAGS
jgi:poly(3-hydroxybutyrate) depolymerase